MSEYLFKIGDFAPSAGGGAVDPKFKVDVVAPPTILLRRLG